MASHSRRFLLVLITTFILIGPLSFIISDGSSGPIAIEPIDDPELPPWGYYRGILPNPQEGGDLGLTYQNASLYTQFVPVWGRPSPFYNLSTDLEGSWGQIFVGQLIRDNGMFPLVHMNFFGKDHTLIQHPSLPTSTLNSSAWRSEYIQSAKDVVNASQPKYLSLGNEVNRWFEAHGNEPSNDNGFQHFISLYNEAYDAVKDISPDTIVFCTFSREIVAENREANMSVLELFDPDRMDLLIITSYPFSVAGINRVIDMPNDYYSSVFDHFPNKPFGFSEVSWTSLSAFGGEIEQASFIRNVTSRLTIDQGLDLHLIGWNWLHDLGPGDATGLVDKDGNAKTALIAWMNNSAPEYRRDKRIIELMEDFGGFSYSLNTTFYDPDTWDILSFFIWNGTGFSNRSSSKVDAVIDGGYMNFTSKDNATGATQLRIQARDWSGLTNWTLIQVNIENVNDPPALTNPLDELVFSEGGSPFFDLSYYIYDSDDPFNTLSLELIEAPGLNVSANLTASPYMVLFAEENDWNGETYALISISDPHGESVIINLTVRVLPINDPPEIRAPGEIIIPEDDIGTYDLSTWVTDEDDGNLLWNITSSDTVNISLSILNDTLTITPSSDWFGGFTLFLNVTDTIEFDVYEIPVTVTPMNDPPVVGTPEVITISEDQVIYFALSDISPLDPDNDPLYWYLENKTSLIGSVAILDNGSIRITPMTDGYGEGEFFLRVQDGRGGVAYTKFSVVVESVNDPPTFLAPEEWSLEIELGSFRIIDLRFTPYFVEDVDDPLEDLAAITDYALTEVNGLVLNISVPPDSASDNISIIVWVRDPQGYDSVLHELKMVIVEDIDHGNGWVEIDNLTFSNPSGDIRIIAEGEPGQTIWVVLTDISGLKGSYLMQESTEQPGYYELVLEDPGWMDGEELLLHLSSSKGGPNDSGDLPLSITYHKGENVVNGNEGSIIPFLIGATSIMTLLVLLAIFIIMRRGKRTISDFDYGSLLEE